MMNTYKHLAQEERLQLYVWFREGQSKREIARRLGRDPGTISRELKRNKPSDRLYNPIYADMKSKKRWSLSNSRKNKVGVNEELKTIVENKLKIDRRSPDTISGRLKIEKGIIVSSQTIYNYIYKENLEWKKYLKYKKGYRRRGIKETRGSIKPLRSIEERPKSVENRKSYGHWEIDTIRGKRYGGGGLLTIIERKSRYCEVERLDTRKSEEVKEKTFLALEKYGKRLLTITRDNGKEFSLFNELENELGMLCFAAHAYASHERGTNEHVNGMIRVFYPKRTDFTKISDEEIQVMKLKLNQKPRKILNYKTPQEVMSGKKMLFFKSVAL